MNTVCCLFVTLLFHQAISGVVRGPPAFSNPVYSDSYLPAAMQVIFHAVDQLKLLQLTEAIANTSPISHINWYEQNQEFSTASTETETTQSDKGIEEDGVSTEIIPETSNTVENTTKSYEIGEESTENTSSEPIEETSNHQESPEVNAETPETNYATPETNYETPEDVQDVQETNEEVPEENHHEWSLSTVDTNASSATETTAGSDVPYSKYRYFSIEISILKESIEQKKKEPTVESVVQEVYEILRPTPSEFLDVDTATMTESKNAAGVSVENETEHTEDENDENRFTRLGERVTQVPRPSLISYLKRARVPPSATLQQLANLYDSLSKDARKQGFGKYTGYSDEVLNTLETSAEGGIVPQLKQLLEKVLERNELMRVDSRNKTRQAIQDLNDPSSSLNKELRPLLPLRYSL
ncbi:PREDICTED: uncharacterized protein LOC107186218 [Dufourea novaeangliae]|uniref:uncharacterized protein LOC107186218 n=1 Tax=Dufourea novaeangliae TaxID=178035 RepID=UPI0007676B70|nr:PREDICTED: uncharacterized protein LOC107186218 [Dufourea novaeangliae]